MGDKYGMVIYMARNYYDITKILSSCLITIYSVVSVLFQRSKKITSYTGFSTPTKTNTLSRNDENNNRTGTYTRQNLYLELTIRKILSIINLSQHHDQTIIHSH